MDSKRERPPFSGIRTLIIMLVTALCSHCPNAGSVREENEIDTHNKAEVSRVKNTEEKVEFVIPVASSVHG